MRLHLKYLYLTLAASAFIGTPASAEPLRDAVSAALQYHPSIEAAIADMDAAKQARREQSSGYFPEISASAVGGRVFQDNSTSRGLSVTRGDAYSYYGEGSVTLRQMVFDGLETSSRVASARAKQGAAINRVADLRETLALRTAQTYVDVLRSRLALVMLAEQSNKIQDYLKRIQTAVNQGASDETELQQARDIETILQTIVSDYEAQARAAETNYIELTGHAPDKDMAKPVPNLDPLPQGIDNAVAVAKESHPAMLSARMDRKAARYDINAERANLYPRFDGELSYLESDKKDVVGGEATDARAVMRMNWNFEVGGAQLARIKQRRLDHKKSQAKIAETERQIERDIRLSYSEYQAAREQLDLLYKRSALNEKLFDTYKTQFEGAKISLLQLMQADNQLFNTRLEQMNGEHRFLASNYGILASTGKLQSALKLPMETALVMQGRNQEDYGQE